MMSAAFCSKSASLESNVALQPVIAAAGACSTPAPPSFADTPSLAAKRRVLQCVDPSVGGLRVALKIFAGTLGVQRNGYLTAVSAVQSCGSLCPKAASPHRHVATAILRSFAHYVRRESFGVQEDDAGTLRASSARPVRLLTRSVSSKLRLGQNNPFSHTCDYSTKSDGMVH